MLQKIVTLLAQQKFGIFFIVIGHHLDSKTNSLQIEKANPTLNLEINIQAFTRQMP